MTPVLPLLVASLAVLFVLVLTVRYLDARSWRRSLLAIELLMPIGLKTDDINCWLNTVAAATHGPRLALLPHPPLVLEVVASAEGIRHVLLVPRSFRATVLGGLRAALPGVRLTETADYLATRPLCTAAAEAVLTKMSVPRSEGTATAVLATLQPLGEHETVVVQWTMTGAGTPAPVPSLVNRQHEDLPAWLAGEELTDSEAIRSARLKQTDAMFHAVLRVGVAGANRAQASAIVGRVIGQYRGLNAPGVLLTKRWWLGPRWAASRLTRLSVPVLGWPLLVSTREAAGLLPIPIGEVALPGVALGLARQLPPPPGMPTTGVHIGGSNYPDMAVPLRLTDVDRLQHLHVIGPTGVGKSTLLANLILQDIAAGHGVVVIDPGLRTSSSLIRHRPSGPSASTSCSQPMTNRAASWWWITSFTFGTSCTRTSGGRGAKTCYAGHCCRSSTPRERTARRSRSSKRRNC